MIEFSQIPEVLQYPRNIRGKLSSVHSDVIEYVTRTYTGSHSLRGKTIRLLNTITRYFLDGDSFPNDWDSQSDPFRNIQIEDELSLKDRLGSLYINPKDVNWDIEIVKDDKPSLNSNTSNKPKSNFKIRTFDSTDKSDLYIQSPRVPQFDFHKPFASKSDGLGNTYVVYTSIPEIPTKQNEISATTDVNLMSESQLLKLFPNNFIRTRSPIMYEPRKDFEVHPKLGVIFPISGFTYQQVVDNIIRYPHMYKLMKSVKGDIVSFYNTIEIDKTLYKLSDVWKDLPDTRNFPHVDFLKEYVVRRYLLERDINHINHVYPMYGTLDPFLTLFTTTSDYVDLGYPDIVEIARKCVLSRVSYKQSRNPVLRRIQGDV